MEVWALPRERFGDFIAGVPAPLAIGTVELDDGSTVKGFLCEAAGSPARRDITGYGGWRAYLDAAGEEGGSGMIPIIDVSPLASDDEAAIERVAGRDRQGLP